MNVLFICDNKADWEIYTNLFKLHFSQLQLICKLNFKDANKYILEEGSPLFTIIDSLLKENSLDDIFLNICKLTEKRPVVFIEPEAPAKKRFPLDFYEVNSANSFIKRPLQLVQFKEVIKKVLKSIQGEMLEMAAVEMDRDGCLPVKIRNFYRFNKVPYDVYMELTHTKFVKIISKNEPYTEGLIQKLMQRKIRFLYLEKKDHLEFLERSLVSLLKIMHTPSINSDSIMVAQITGVAIMHEYVRTVGVSDKILSLAKKIIEKTFKVYRDLRTINEVIKRFPFEQKDLSDQAILTMYICEAIINDMGWGNDIMRHKLGLASLIHDCMLTNDDMIRITRMDDPNLEMFSDEEKEEYRQHPLKTAEAALSFQGFPEAEFIISQHHELPDGKGFPHGLNSHQITALSCVFIIANNFVGELANKGLKRESIKSIIAEFSEKYDVGNFKQPLKSLRKFFL